MRASKEKGTLKGFALSCHAFIKLNSDAVVDVIKVTTAVSSISMLENIITVVESHLEL